MSIIYKGLKYQFCAGDGDSGNHLFILKREGRSSTGYYQLRLAGPLDYETMQSPIVTIRVRVTDSRNKTFEKKITLNVLDVLERPENLEVDIVMLGAGGGGGGFDDGRAGPGGSGGQYAFSTTVPYSGRYAFIVGSGGKGGTNSGSYSVTGGPGGEVPAGANVIKTDFDPLLGVAFVANGGRGGNAGLRGSSGGGGGGGAATQFVNWSNTSNWQLLAIAGGGGGGTGRRELPAWQGGKGGSSLDIATRTGGEGGGGYNTDSGGDGPGGGGGGGGLLGGSGSRRTGGFIARRTIASIGGSSGKDSGFGNIADIQAIEGNDGNVVSGSWTFHGLTSPTEIGSTAGKWWDGLFTGGVGQGGYSGITVADRSFSNGGSGAAMIRYKSDTIHADGWPKLKVGGAHQILNGYHIHYFDKPGISEFSLDLYE